MNEKIKWYEDNAPGYPGGSSAGPYFRSEAEYESYCDQVCEKWNEEHPECIHCGERDHIDEMFKDCGGEPVHEDCSDICIKCKERYPHNHMECFDDAGDHMICVDCSER